MREFRILIFTVNLLVQRKLHSKSTFCIIAKARGIKSALTSGPKIAGKKKKRSRGGKISKEIEKKERKKQRKEKKKKKKKERKTKRSEAEGGGASKGPLDPPYPCLPDSLIRWYIYLREPR
jgi:hypothetical protein